jgi:hypothetical protein
MTVTITAEPVPARWAVALTVAGQGNAAVAIEAEPVGRAAYPVRLIGDPSGDPLTADDYEAPFGVPIRYRVYVAGQLAASVLAEPVDVGACVLSSTNRPASALPVSIVSALPNEWQTRSTFFDVIGRRDPLVSVDVARYRSGEWGIYVRGNAARAALLELLTPGHPLLMRSGSEFVDDVIALPLTWVEDPHLDETGGRVVTVRWQAVTRTLGPYRGLAEWSYAILANDPTLPTYAALLPAFATYRDLYAGPVVDPIDLPNPDPFGVFG